MADTRIVALVGPRQSGKTTLARKIAASQKMNFITLGDEQFRKFAIDDPGGFVRGLNRAVIDEIQRVPDLILALKKAVDEDRRPGRFLITGSVDLFKSALSPDSLAGRVEAIELLPFSQAEIERRQPSDFLGRLFQADFPSLQDTGQTPDLIARVLAGGYPEALTRPSETRRKAWFSSYFQALSTRDVADIANITKTDELSRLIGLSSVMASQLLNISSLASPLGVDSKTVDRWLFLLEQMFVVRRVRAWHRNDLKRLIKSPKIHFLDSGLLAALRKTAQAELRADRSKLGGLLQGFVFSELSKMTSLNEDGVALSHFRDRDQVEIDFILERIGQIACVEVKASALAKPDDFSGMKRLRDAVGDAFKCGVLLHDGDRIQKVGDRLFAMPISQLWV